MDQERLQYLILNALSDVGPVTFHRLMERFQGKVGRIFSMSYEELASIGGVSRKAAERITHWSNYFDPQKEYEQLVAINGIFLSQKEAAFPPLLKKIYDIPIGLYVRGKTDFVKKRCIAIVGTRKPSWYGIKIARDFSKELANLGFTIVSGMALGIDTAAHEGALASQKPGATIAVLGSGLNVIYPKENAKLYQSIIENGSVLSEFILNRPADKVTFPIRNRVIAGMCEYVLVIESDQNGGSMITAHIANEYGRNVLAIPGRIDQKTSIGCHALIREGATLIGSFDQLLEELQSTTQRVFDFSEHPMPELSDPVERRIIEKLRSEGDLLVDELADHLATPIQHLLPRLQLLELRQMIKRNAQGAYEYVR